MQVKFIKFSVRITGSLLNDIKTGKMYNVLNKEGMWIVTDTGEEYNLRGSYNEENYVVQYEIIT